MRMTGPGIVSQVRHHRAVAADLLQPEERRLQHAGRADELEAILDAQVRCRDCGRPLRDPASVARKIGPDCLEKRSVGQR